MDIQYLHLFIVNKALDEVEYKRLEINLVLCLKELVYIFILCKT